jgi:hypothetical protein
LGTGHYWNTFIDTLGAFTTGTFDTATDFRDDGVTHSGIFASVAGGNNDSGLSSTPPSTNIAALFGQDISGATSLTFTGVPDGFYNLVIFGVSVFTAGGSTYTVNATNGVQDASTDNIQALFFEQGDNSVLFTNVQVAGGTLLVNIQGNPGADPVNGNSQNGTFNGAQLQLISYSPTISDVSLSSTYSLATHTLTLTWSEGVLQSSTNLNGQWKDITDPSPVTINTTNNAQFFRLKVE